MKLSEPIWRLLWDYIANESPDEDYSAEMAELLCESILPQVWDEVAKMEAYADKLADGLPLLPKDIEILQKANTDFAMANTQLESSLAEAREERDAFKLLYQLSNKPVTATQEEIIAAHQVVQAHFKAGGEDDNN